jgi:Flp pilus assembly protein TadG
VLSTDLGVVMRMLNARSRKSQRGAAQIEFALSILIVLFLVFWMWEFVMLVYTYAVLSDAAKEGVRYAIVHGGSNTNCSGPIVTGATCPSGGDTAGNNIKTQVMTYANLSLHDVSAISIQPTWPDTTNNPPNRVKVTITYPYVPYIQLPWTSPTISVSAEGRIVF